MLFVETLYGRWLFNTAFVGVLVVAITLLLALPAGYALARLTGRWGEQLGIGIFLTYLVPPTLLFIPLSRVVAILGLQDSLWSLVLVYPSFTIPFCTWLLMGFFKAIPGDLEEAAMIDGCSRFGAFLRVVIPISVAGVLTVVIFAFTLVTQEFVYAMTFISGVRQFTVSVGVPTFLVRGDVYFWGSLMAGCFIASVPIAILYNFFVDRFIAGFTVGRHQVGPSRIRRRLGARRDAASAGPLVAPTDAAGRSGRGRSRPAAPRCSGQGRPRRRSARSVSARITVPVAADGWIGHAGGEAAEDAEAVHEALDLVAGRDEGVRHPLVDDEDRAAGCQELPAGTQDVDRARHVVERLEDRDEVVPARQGGVGGVADGRS